MKLLQRGNTMIAVFLSSMIIAVLGWSGVRALAQPLTYRETSLADAIPQVGRIQAHTSVNATLALTATVYLPTIFKPATIDLSITSLEATQSVQTDSNSVPMVAGRVTVLRVYAKTSSVQPASGIQVSVSGTRGGSPLPGSPLLIGPGSVSPLPSRGWYTSTFNVQLPTVWTSGQVDLVTRVDSANAVTEVDEGNNTASLTLNFNSVPALDIMIVPVNYTHTPNGQLYPAPTVDTVSDWIMRSYPVNAVNISWHAPINFTGDLKSNMSDWSALLDQVTVLWGSETHPAGQVYYGLVPIKNSTSNWLGSGGVVGYGWIGWRTAIGLDLTGGGWSADSTGQTAAHEIGHNFGRRHAPCGNPAGPDPSYPYANASIGQYGLDISKARVWSPDTTKDLMSYCSPKWLSDYTYLGLYNDQRSNGLVTTSIPPTEVLMIRASFDGDVPSLRPIYSLSSVPSALPPSSEYDVELLDGDGRVMVSYPVSVLVAEESDMKTQAIHALVPRPAQPVARVRLVRGGVMVTERMLSASAATLSVAIDVERSADAVTLHWGAPNVPALVRYTLDDGQAWTTVGVDVLGGQLALDSHWLPAGTVRFEVRLADGGGTLSAELGR